MTPNHDHSPADPIQGAFPWVGGKRVLAKTLVPMIEAIPHACYAEPFIGAGGLFLRRRFRPTSEAINDRSRDIATFFRVLQRHPDALMAELRFGLASRSEFERLRRIDPDTLTDIERAGRLFYLQYCAYGGKPGAVWVGSPLTRARFNRPRLETLLRRIHDRLAAVYIDCLDFEAFIRRWDRPTTLFYLDPPYWGCEDYYGKKLFERPDFDRLAGVLKGLQGRFLMSLNDVPEVRQTFAGFRIEQVKTVYRVSGAAKTVTELVISG